MRKVGIVSTNSAARSVIFSIILCWRIIEGEAAARDFGAAQLNNRRIRLYAREPFLGALGDLAVRFYRRRFSLIGANTRMLKMVRCDHLPAISTPFIDHFPAIYAYGHGRVRERETT